MCTTCNNDETPRTCEVCAAEATASNPLNESSICLNCLWERYEPAPAALTYQDGEYRLQPAYQEEQYSARWEDRYGPYGGEDEPGDCCGDWEDDGEE